MRSLLVRGVTQHWLVDSSWNVVAQGNARVGKWRGNWRMEWVASTLHTTSEHGVSSITTADALTTAASSRLNWRPRWFKWTRPFRWKTKSGFCACAITFQTLSTYWCFGTTCRFHLQKSSSPRKFLDCLTLVMGSKGCPETSITSYHSALHNTSEERRCLVCYIFCVKKFIINNPNCGSCTKNLNLSRFKSL